jgi:acyl carrier protein
MNEQQARDVILNALCNLAAEIDASSVDPGGPSRYNSIWIRWTFLNFVTGIEEDIGILILETDYPKISTLSGCVVYVLSAYRHRKRAR